MSTATKLETSQPQPPTETNFEAIKQKQQATWASGNYAVVGSTLQITGEQLCEAMDLRSGATALDVAAGNGNASLAAARRFCHVVSTDYVADLLEKAKVRAAADGLAIEFQTADAENLPFENESYDNVLSTFGVMFAPNQTAAAQELLRVCKPGGKIGMANWTPGSFIGQLFKTIGQYVAPPPRVSSPANWGDEAFIQTHFAPSATTISITKKMFVFRYLSADHWLEVFRSYYGPTLKAFESLTEENRTALSNDIMALIERFNQSDDSTMVVPSEYLEVVVEKK